jgi:hypothetical protein
MTRGGGGANANSEQKFFGSFFQKRTAFLPGCLFSCINVFSYQE